MTTGGSFIYDRVAHEIGTPSSFLDIQVSHPSFPLAKLIDKYIILRNERKSANSSIWYLLPDNSVHLIFYLIEENSTLKARWRLIGPRSKHKMLNRVNRVFTFICTFRPGGFVPFTKTPINELVNQSLEAKPFLAEYDQEVFEQLRNFALCSAVPSFINTLESFLLGHNSTLHIHPVIEDFHQNSGTAKAEEIANSLGYSSRQLRNLSSRYIGHSPKLVSQIERFTNTLKLTSQTDNWTDICYDAGYYDQSHMISAFQRFVGTTPDQLLG